MRIVVFLILCITCSVSGHAQKVKRKLPTDLDVSKVIFLQYEEIPIDDSYPKWTKKVYENYNQVFKRTNPKLTKEAKSYPFEYTISKRAVYRELKSQGYKYVLESRLMEKTNNGTFVPNSNERLFDDIYLEDMETNEKYILFEISQSDLFDYKEIMKKLVKLINKEYDLP